MATSLASQVTDFTRDVMGRYLCNGLDEARRSADPANPDTRPFDVIVIGGGTFGAALAQHLFAADATHSHRILVLEGGPFVLPEHVQNVPMLGLDPPSAAVTDPGPRNEVWGLPWNTDVPMGFPGLAYCIGGRSLFWGGWSPILLDITGDTEMPRNRWPDGAPNPLVTELNNRYFREASDQIGVTETNDFIYGALHNALRQQLFAGIGQVADAIPLAPLPDHPALRFRNPVLPPPTVAELLDLLNLPAPTGPPPQPADLRNLMKLEAPLAVQTRTASGLFPINKFSSVPLLLKAARAAQNEAQRGTGAGSSDVNKRLMVVPECHVTRLITQVSGGVGRITAVDTGQGVVPVPPTGVVIIALGTIESTRLALVSFGGISNYDQIGRGLLAHLRSNLTIRITRAALETSPSIPAEIKQQLQAATNLQASALFLKGKRSIGGTVRHFHLQITASGLGAVGTDAEAELFKKVPDIDGFDAFRAATRDHIVITIRGIGEMEPDNPANRVTLDLNPARDDEFGIRRAFVQIAPTAGDMALWEAMDQATDEVARAFAGNNPYEVFVPPQGTPNEIRPVPAGQLAQTVLPHVNRRDGLGTTYHEAGTLRMGTASNASVTNGDGRFHAVENAFAAGPALFPTIGSPNPMLTGIAIARRTADKLSETLPHPVAPAVEPGFQYLFDGTEQTFNNWQKVGANAFALIDGQIITSGSGDFSILYFPSTFGDFTLRLQFAVRDPLRDNSGVFVRFRNPLAPLTQAILGRDTFNDIPRNRAWVAVYSGFEVQIDEQALGDTRIGEPNGLDMNRTGAIYKISTGPNGLQQFQRGPALQPGQWNEYEIQVAGNTYTVKLNGQQTTRFVRPNTAAFQDRGISPQADPSFGYIGLQSYFGSRVAFRNIRIKP